MSATEPGSAVPRGSAHPKAQLNETLVFALRYAYEERGWTVAQCCRWLEAELGRPWDHGNMHRILNRKSWRHVP